MRRSNFFLPALSVGLLYLSMYLGLIVMNLRGTTTGQGGGLLVHYALVALWALVVCLLARKGLARIRPVFVIFALMGLFILAIPILPEAIFARLFMGKPPVLVLSMAIFTPIGLFLFARNIPLGREGFAYAMMLSVGEILWSFVFPLFSLIAMPSSQQAMYLFSLCCYLIGAAGLCVAYTLATTRESEAPAYAPTSNMSKWRLLGILVVAVLANLVLIGLYMGMFAPKSAIPSGTLSVAHFLLLFLLPLAGRFMDSQPKRTILACIPIFACIFLLGLAYNNGLIGQMSFYYLLGIMRTFLQVVLYATVTRLFKTHALLPLLITWAYALTPFQLIGLMLRKQLFNSPHGMTTASLFLVLIVMASLWLFRRNFVLLEPQPIAEDSELKKLSAFSAAYTLTARERDVLLALVNGVDRETMAQKLGLTVRTVRYHLSNLQKKTSMPNEKSLIDYYNSWR